MKKRLKFIKFDSMKGYERLQGKLFWDFWNNHYLTLDGISKSKRNNYCVFVHDDSGAKVCHWMNNHEKDKLLSGFIIASKQTVNDFINYKER